MAGREPRMCPDPLRRVVGEPIESAKEAERIKEAQDRMQASGFAYELAAGAHARTLRIAEDGAAEKEISLPAGQSQQGSLANPQ